LASLYLPFSWLILMSGPWDSYRWHWIKLWPVLPGLPAGLVLHPKDHAENLLSGIVTAILIAIVTAMGARSRRALIITNMIALSCASMTSWLAFALFRS